MKIILDTDIGDDIDDVWALGLLLACKEADIELISICFAGVQYKSAVAIYFLNSCAKFNVPIALGREAEISNMPHKLPLSVDKSKFCIKDNAVLAIKEVLDSSTERVDIISIGPATNIADFARQYPEYREKYRVIAMAGSYKKGYINKESACEEYNVIADVQSANAAYKLCDYIMIPLDVCRDAIIDGMLFESLKSSDSIIVKTILKLYDEWQKYYVGGAIKFDHTISSSILYDIVPVYYLLNPSAFKTEFVRMKALSNGCTVQADDGNMITVATEVDRERMLNDTVEILLRSAE